jgi:Domain of unknown function (DUF6430)
MHDLLRDLRTLRFWRWFARDSLAALGVLVLLLEAVNFVLPDDLPVDGAPLAIILVVVSLGFGLFQAWPQPIEHSYDSPNTRIRIIKGDLFGQDCHVVIGTCDTFDTAVPTVIAPTSLQAQSLERLYGGDVARLDTDLAQALAGKTIVGTISKAGKTDRYGVGSIAALRHGPHWAYFLAYSEMNEHNEAHSTTDGIWKSLSSLWQEISRTANGTTVAMPVVGGGMARISQLMPAQDAIRLTILSFMFASRKARICDELRIVVRPQDFDRLDRLQLQSFLNSMRAS